MNFLMAVGFMAACLYKPTMEREKKRKILELQVCLFFAGCWSYNQKWGPADHHSKVNKEASLVERKVCFILDADNQRGGGWTPI